tara:strand:+ start:465 stop:1106 length:642 start_codon:yes stop_codon:yes gene_type:complete
MSENQIQIYKPFGPTIAKVKIPETLISKLNSYIDKTILDKEKSQKLDWGKQLAGNVTQEFRLEPELCDEIGFSKFLSSAVAKWIEMSEGKKISKLQISSSWVVRQFQNEYNPIHHHSGHISGVGYLKVPKNFGETFQPNNSKQNTNGFLSLIHGNRLFNSESVFNIEPKVGDFYFFPNHLMHTVYPFYNNNDERRSISFNAKIDEDIYNVYGK